MQVQFAADAVKKQILLVILAQAPAEPDWDNLQWDTLTQKAAE